MLATFQLYAQLLRKHCVPQTVSARVTSLEAAAPEPGPAAPEPEPTSPSMAATAGTKSEPASAAPAGSVPAGWSLSVLVQAAVLLAVVAWLAQLAIQFLSK